MAQRLGIMPAHVVLVRRNTIPHTTSGKLQRNQLKTNYEQVVETAVFVQ
ncbi:MAG: hypothetical protein KDE56_15195 [Anaerolineales bacterium]|nr:hypothetical protein [Anaerolineales bacterium]